MPMTEDDSCSTSSWQSLRCSPSSLAAHQFDEARSDASWNVVEEQNCIAGSTSSFENDMCSDNCSTASWDFVDVQVPGPPAVDMFELLRSGAEKTFDACSHLEHPGASIIDLASSSQWGCALNAILTEKDARIQLRQRDSYGESALSWAVYKSSGPCSASCLEFVCRSILLVPDLVRAPSKRNFLPLHDAAWGNAPPAIAIILCAAFPQALYHVAQGQTPHQVGEYYHTKINHRKHLLFPWPAPEVLMQQARQLSEFSDEANWLSSLVIALAQVRHVPSQTLTSLTSADWVRRFGIPLACGTLLEDYFKPRQAYVVTMAPTTMPSIPELSVPGGTPPTQKRMRKGWWTMSARKERSMIRVTGLPSRKRSADQKASLLNDEGDGVFLVDHLREPCPKNCSRFAGFRRGRNNRCSFSAVMLVADEAGRSHHLTLHTVHALRSSVQKERAPSKWPSKWPLQREREWERREKKQRSYAYEHE